MPSISQLSAAQLSRHAFNVFLFLGRSSLGGRLIYHSLAINSHEPLALRCLSDFWDQPDFQSFSVIPIEYALAPNSPLIPGERNDFEKLRRFSQWTWGFSTHQSGLDQIDEQAFSDPSQFIVDEKRYRIFVQEVVDRAGSMDMAMRGIHTLTGAVSGLLIHETKGSEVMLDEIFYPERFRVSDTYMKWLGTPTKELDKLEDARSNM